MAQVHTLWYFDGQLLAGLHRRSARRGRPEAAVADHRHLGGCGLRCGVGPCRAPFGEPGRSQTDDGSRSPGDCGPGEQVLPVMVAVAAQVGNVRMCMHERSGLRRGLDEEVPLVCQESDRSSSTRSGAR